MLFPGWVLTHEPWGNFFKQGSKFKISPGCPNIVEVLQFVWLPKPWSCSLLVLWCACKHANMWLKVYVLVGVRVYDLLECKLSLVLGPHFIKSKVAISGNLPMSNGSYHGNIASLFFANCSILVAPGSWTANFNPWFWVLALVLSFKDHMLTQWNLHIYQGLGLGATGLRYITEHYSI